MNLFLCLHLCSGAPTLSVCSRDDVHRCDDDPPPWWITCVGGWRVYPVAIYNLPEEAKIGLTHINFPADAVDTFTGRHVLDEPKFDLVAAMRKARPVEPIKRRI